MARLLIVIDDDPDQRRFLERTLQAAGYRIVTAAEGADAFLTKPVEFPELLRTIEGLVERE
jgi:DNA-binding response OmpR family regulator